MRSTMLFPRPNATKSMLENSILLDFHSWLDSALAGIPAPLSKRDYNVLVWYSTYQIEYPYQVIVHKRTVVYYERHQVVSIYNKISCFTILTGILVRKCRDIPPSSTQAAGRKEHKVL